MSDFAYAYFSTEMDKLELPLLEEIFEKAKRLILKKKTTEMEFEGVTVDAEEVAKINAVYSKISKEEQTINCNASMQSMWEVVKDDSW